MTPHLLPRCPDPLPEDLDRELKRIGDLWAEHPVRPRLDAAVARHWDELVRSWSVDPELPLLIRKKQAGVARGEMVKHESGRQLVLTDNSPASWSYMLAFAREDPSLDNIRGYFERAEIPVAMVVDGQMHARAHYIAALADIANPNVLGWKVCHRRRVALHGHGAVQNRDIAHLQSHLRNFLSPSNMFLVPLELAGLGELPHFIDAIGDDV